MTANRKPAPNGTGPQEDATKLFEIEFTKSEPIPAQVRRRRAASLRCEPLTNGRRDTLSRRVESDPRRLLVEVGRRTVWLRDGERGDRVFALLNAAQVEQRQWDSGRRCWMVSVSRADDVIAFAEYAERWSIAVEAVDR